MTRYGIAARSSEGAAILGRGFAGKLAKRGGERARLAEADAEPDLRHRQRALGQQGLGALDAPAREIPVRRHAERLLERAGEMERAQPRFSSQGCERDLVGKMRVDVLRQLLLLPGGQPSA